MRALPALALAVALVVLGAEPVEATETPWLVPPVDASVSRRFEDPGASWGAGHRGIDYAAAPGTAVRASAQGVVSFAGPVAGNLAVSIDHAGGLTTTYTRLSEVFVGADDVVDVGRWIGRTGSAHAGVSGLHFGVKLDGAYVDPLAYLGPVDGSNALRLAPFHQEVDGCRDPDASNGAIGAPNDNVAVAIAGISSKTRGGVDADIYETGPEHLGYPPDRVYRFSYRGVAGPRLHRRYTRQDTYGDLRVAAARLRDLLEEIRRRHPDRGVDLIAHSQGGVVARVFLEAMARTWDPALPPVEHLVTFATPHTGAPLADAIEDIASDGSVGSLVLDHASGWSRAGGPLPDPYSVAVTQLRTDSDLISWMQTEDIAYGTRALALAMPHDVIVPADRSRFDGEANRILPPEGGNGHGGIVRSRLAHAVARTFLRDARPTCPGGWDRWGGFIGRAIGFVEGRLGALFTPSKGWFGKRRTEVTRAVATGMRWAGRQLGRVVRLGTVVGW
ncbi:MAG: peptidoglycan DD-metalloendopeptidase family protein [Actinomycetota bacterium]